MGKRMVLSENEAYELLAHLVASAEICTFEPYYYGTFRLIDAASRLMDSMLKNGSNGSRHWLEDFKREVDERKVWMMWDREGYFEFLREATGKVAAELKRRKTLESMPVEPSSREGRDGDVASAPYTS